MMSDDIWKFKVPDLNNMSNDELIALINGEGTWLGYLLRSNFPDDWKTSELTKSDKRYELMKAELIKRLGE